jgi:hypothetical protein
MKKGIFIMKKIPFYSLLIISAYIVASASIQGMESDLYIGDIDKLMIMHKIAKKGIARLEQKINRHTEIVHWETPFEIRYQNLKNDGSELSTKISSFIAQKTQYFSTNPSNRLFNESYPVYNPIDECTCWVAIQDSNEIDIMSAFYNKAALIAVLKQLNS